VKIFLLFIASLPISCVLTGDCWPDITPAVRVNPRFENQPSLRLIVAWVPKIYEEDVTGVDAQGVPVGARSLTPLDSPPLNGFPYPTWFVAFLDANDNQHLDSGEVFGVDPNNPVDPNCNAYTTRITIDRIRR
jgi:hypothetical protein